MVPLDCWFTMPAVARTFSDNSKRVSLAVHGMEHVYRELGAQRSYDESVALLQAACKRLDRFTRRTGLDVGRVMVPPHGATSIAINAPLAATGFEAMCAAGRWWWDWPEEARAAAGITTADMSPAGLATFSRHYLRAHDAREQALIAAWLDQPVVWYGHHEDLAGGYDVMREHADWLAGVDETRWMSLRDIARTNANVRVDDERAQVMMYSRRIDAVVPRPAKSVVLAQLRTCRAPTRVRFGATVAVLDPAGRIMRSRPLPVTSGETLELVTEEAAEAAKILVFPGRTRPRVIARRAAVEARDRLKPFLHTVGLSKLVNVLEAQFRRRRSSVAT